MGEVMVVVVKEVETAPVGPVRVAARARYRSNRRSLFTISNKKTPPRHKTEPLPTRPSDLPGVFHLLVFHAYWDNVDTDWRFELFLPQCWSPSNTFPRSSAF